jgi:translation elongation factor EF-G
VSSVPLLSLAIHPKTAGDRDKLERGLRQIIAEDPTLRADAGPNSGDVTIGASGELQLEIAIDRLKREFEVEATLGRPEVVYRAGWSDVADGDGNARPVILEPVMRVEVVTPREHVAAVIGGLLGRRGEILSSDASGDRHIVLALVPLAELFGYTISLRGSTRGRATCSQRLDRFQEVRVDPGRSDDDRISQVAAPLRPVPSLNEGGVALPEPDDDPPEPLDGEQKLER